MTSPSHRIALFSLNEPSDGLEFAPRLLGLGWKIVATQNVALRFAESGIQTEEVFSFPGNSRIISVFRPRSIQK